MRVGMCICWREPARGGGRIESKDQIMSFLDKRHARATGWFAQLPCSLEEAPFSVLLEYKVCWACWTHPRKQEMTESLFFRSPPDG